MSLSNESLSNKICRLFINTIKNNTRSKIDSLPDDYPAYVFRGEKHEIGVCVPAVCMNPIYEPFEGFCFRSTSFEEESGDIKDYLALSMYGDDIKKYEFFAVICQFFVGTDESGEQRRSIICNPDSFILLLKELIGNQNVETYPYSVIGELIAFDIQLQNGNEPSWDGPDMQTIDIRGKNCDVEVKSTTTRNKYEVTISSEYQLMRRENDLFLYYCIFEESSLGKYSIDRMVERLRKHGADIGDIENKLSSFGYISGSSARKKCYDLIEMWDFCVDEDFPKIVPDSFINHQKPEGVKKILYTIDLSSVKKENPLYYE